MKDTFFNKGEEIFFEIEFGKYALKKLTFEQFDDLLCQAKAELKRAELDADFQIDFLKIDVIEDTATAEWHFINNSTKVVRELEE